MAGTFTYAGTASGDITSARDKVRLELGDTDSSAVLYYDDELDVWIDARGSASYLLAAADAADAAARKFARAYDFETDGQRFSRSQMSKMYRELAKDLRSRSGGITTVDVTKIDGWSDDVANQEVTGGGTANPRHYHYRVGVADLPELARCPKRGIGALLPRGALHGTSRRREHSHGYNRAKADIAADAAGTYRSNASGAWFQASDGN